jgi:hypothetical protein
MLPIILYLQRLGWLEIGYNEVSRVVSFSQGDMRVNVYYTTGIEYMCMLDLIADK